MIEWHKVAVTTFIICAIACIGWAMAYESRIWKLEYAVNEITRKTQENTDGIAKMDLRLNGIDVQLAKIQKDVEQILFEIRKR